LVPFAGFIGSLPHGFLGREAAPLLGFPFGPRLLLTLLDGAIEAVQPGFRGFGQWRSRVLDDEVA
jgi:hypothetical protein